MLKSYIRKLLNNQIFEKSILILILLNLIIFILDSMSAFHSLFNDYIRRFEVFSIIVFTVEYILRVLSVERVKDIFKPMMLIDFFAVAPFYLSSVNTIFLRVLRFSRILRIMKISRYSQALDNIINAFKAKKEELIITLSIFAVSVLLSAILMYLTEHDAQPQTFSSVPKCIYFAIITFTSVGYGDITPITKLGEIVCSLIAIFGIGLHGLFIGVIGTAFMEAFRK
ncbi:MAG: ion transporter [Muribaculaceae bacterium]|nr:ion transporter [Muribaculaceae bacterium]